VPKKMSGPQGRATVWFRELERERSEGKVNRLMS